MLTINVFVFRWYLWLNGKFSSSPGKRYKFRREREGEIDRGREIQRVQIIVWDKNAKKKSIKLYEENVAFKNANILIRVKQVLCVY